MKKAAAKKARPKGPDAIALLKDDHRKVSKMFASYDKLGDAALATKLRLARTLCKELKVHTRIEEEIFYPAVEKALPKEKDLLDEAEVEHEGAKRLIAELDRMKPGQDLFDAKVTVLAEYIKHHVKEEHEDMFPKVRKTDLDLRALGARMAARKATLAKRKR